MCFLTRLAIGGRAAAGSLPRASQAQTTARRAASTIISPVDQCRGMDRAERCVRCEYGRGGAVDDDGDDDTNSISGRGLDGEKNENKNK